MRPLERRKKSFSALNILLIVQLILMFGISIGVTQLISKEATKSSDTYMMTIAEERSRIILNYVENIRKTLSEYSHAGEILNVLENPSDDEARSAALAYTESFSGDIVNLEGIYVSEWNTHVLAHTNSKVSGMTTRSGGALEELQKALLNSEDGIFESGVISSPASGKQILSMYKVVFNRENSPAGIVGIGVYTDGLINLLDTLSECDTESSFYSMMDAANKEYIFCSDSGVSVTGGNIPELILLCDVLNGTKDNSSGKFTYEADGIKYVSMYSYMADRGWIFMMNDTEDEMYSLTGNMRSYLIIFIIFCILLIVIFNIINKKHEDTSQRLNKVVEKQEKTRENLSNALFRDMLTDMKNRVSFSNDFEEGKISCEAGHVYYFAMFNVRRFSEINILYGEEAGDMVLVAASAVLKKCFPNSVVYRTGSDEFFVVTERSGGDDAKDVFFSELSRAVKNLSMPVNIGDGTINVYYSVAAARKSNNINISVIPSLKSIMNMNEANGASGKEIIDLDSIK